MSLIEKAAKRLEELKRSGVDVSDLSIAGDSNISRKASAIPAASSSPPLDALPDEQNGTGARPLPRAKEDISDSTKPIFQIDLKKLAATGCVTPDAPRSRIAEEFRHLKRTLLANASGKSTVPVKNANLVMITSAVPGEGKTFSAVSLAMSLAMEVDRTVLLVDADVARPALPALLELPESRGLLDALESRFTSLGELLIHTNIEKLTILPSGATRPTATELLASDAMNNLLDELSARYPDRIIIFDSPPLLATTESRALATHMGQIVFVVNAEHTLRSDVAQGLAAIEACPIKLLLLNKANTTSSGGYGGYGYYGNEQI
jgi:protein-tyrosine kinase